MTTDSQPSEQPNSTAKFGFPEVVKLGPVRPLSPEEREEWNRNSPSFAQASLRKKNPPTAD
ncbi:MAG: hypothetical protein OXG38_04745 [Chloroflexi bacterium]|nr:hypothetical protein [Chloroflexota bacterium]